AVPGRRAAACGMQDRLRALRAPGEGDLSLVLELAREAARPAVGLGLAADRGEGRVGRADDGKGEQGEAESRPRPEALKPLEPLRMALRLGARRAGVVGGPGERLRALRLLARRAPQLR